MFGRPFGVGHFEPKENLRGTEWDIHSPNAAPQLAISARDQFSSFDDYGRDPRQSAPVQGVGLPTPRVLP